MSLRPTSHFSHSWGGSSESHPAFIPHRYALRRPENRQGTTVCDKSWVAVQPLEASIADAAAVPPKPQLQWAAPSTAAPTIGSTRAGTALECQGVNIPMDNLHPRGDRSQCRNAQLLCPSLYGSHTISCRGFQARLRPSCLQSQPAPSHIL